MGVEKAKICPKCKSKMGQGVVPDRAGNYEKGVLQWGEKINLLGWGLKNSANIVAYKCVTCGYIELYSKKK
ncbi:hypothetical protein KBB41_01365 [Candidatus Curtissbacteria bacterium]|nr:hypothetical protein [Candidatus Curtissbacteria bacterium]